MCLKRIMQRSLRPQVAGHIVQPRFHGIIDGAFRTKSSSSWGHDDGGRPKMPRSGTPQASATSTVRSDAGSYSRGANASALARRINREDNMWRDSSYIDTKWLHPHDPSAFRPNFSQTEPTSLRKQFMRSPDEISREVMGRDWEETVKNYKRSSVIARGGNRNESWQAKDTTRNRQQHLHVMHMQQQQEQQQQQQQQLQQLQQQQKQQQQKNQMQQKNYWGKNNYPKNQ
ncbi:ras-interacting protein RIP3 [Drosophila elegans]|uniref:ras-interacting protein RIP3 n=1 Tax=Drosophila elegans TaxID=30023 RepID=UPI0007E7E1B8|nr:ras-interacting protein RIP3 [Drosophila elegans]